MSDEIKKSLRATRNTSSPVTAKELFLAGAPSELGEFDATMITKMRPILFKASSEFAELFSKHYQYDAEIKGSY